MHSGHPIWRCEQLQASRLCEFRSTQDWTLRKTSIVREQDVAVDSPLIRSPCFDEGLTGGKGSDRREHSSSDCRESRGATARETPQY